MIKEIINTLKSELPATVKLVAVSKFHPFEAIRQAYEAGQRIFAESRPQELLAKVNKLEEIRAERGEPDYMSDIEWHFIGHLQTNKLKMVLPYVSVVQSVDSVRLLSAINSWGEVNMKKINVLLEPHVAAEETKQGFSREEISAILSEADKYGWICFKGIMGMATFTDDLSVVRGDFAALRSIYDSCLEDFPSLSRDFTELSIGMSDDYPVAIEYGSTMVRIGSMIFGARQY
ncbi:MAG: YggS family pyridoxal phosphate-dependent enzyme [Bacteroidales bacterium]|nr:YggS family pyridoxal phosphate-dependent enzyme [Bacteroidales bacterium]MBQ8811447.1 YggS family pyridoxal phosphate-dependent enzyme [Bacteroidales bacterium]